jgi:ethanolamine ammonia-lyase large subunit
VPGADDVMLNYQSTSYHDVLAVRQALGLKPAPEFCDWLTAMGLMNERGLVRPVELPDRFLPLLTKA